jgi:hypothetical protein
MSWPATNGVPVPFLVYPVCVGQHHSERDVPAALRGVMRTQVLGALVFASTIGAAASQTSGPETAQPSPGQSQDAAKPLTLVGCVQASEAGSNQFTLADDSDKISTYRLSGRSMKKYAGRRVEVVGGMVSSSRLKITGGLLPSPNVAAQAGAIDPSQAANAGSAGNGAGSGELPEFRVKTVRQLGGACHE